MVLRPSWPTSQALLTWKLCGFLPHHQYQYQPSPNDGCLKPPAHSKVGTGTRQTGFQQCNDDPQCSLLAQYHIQFVYVYQTIKYTPAYNSGVTRLNKTFLARGVENKCVQCREEVEHRACNTLYKEIELKQEIFSATRRW